MGLASKAHRLLYHSTLGSRVTKKKKKRAGTGPSPEGPTRRHEYLSSNPAAKGVYHRTFGTSIEEESVNASDEILVDSSPRSLVA